MTKFSFSFSFCFLRLKINFIITLFFCGINLLAGLNVSSLFRLFTLVVDNSCCTVHETVYFLVQDWLAHVQVGMMNAALSKCGRFLRNSREQVLSWPVLGG